MKLGQYKARLGTQLHKIIENYIVDNIDDISKKEAINVEYDISNRSNFTKVEDFCFYDEFYHFKEWFKTKNYKIEKVEWKIKCKKLHLSGIVDCVIEDLDYKSEFKKETNFKHSIIIDWKRTDKDLENEPFKEYCKIKPFNKIKDNKLGRYTVQMNLYKHMIETENPEIKITGLLLVQISSYGVKEIAIEMV